MKLALGTVQLGIPYGIANQTGMPDDTTALEILRAAHEHGYTWLDTAAGYGQSEAVIGRLAAAAWKGSFENTSLSSLMHQEHQSDPVKSSNMYLFDAAACVLAFS